MTDRALSAYFEPDTERRLTRLYEVLDVDATYRPRLETVLDALVEVYGVDGLGDVLSDLMEAPPNVLHEFFSKHVEAGGVHITANFDTCIERCSSRTDPPGLSAQNEGLAQPVLHFHGLLASGNASLEQLGATLTRIQDGFASETDSALDTVLLDPATKALVFVGYSGSDYFDATPYLLDRAHQMEHVVVHWHDFAPDRFAWIDRAMDEQPSLVAGLAQAGITVTRSTGQLTGLLDELSATWGFNVRKDSHEAQPRPRWRSTLDATDATDASKGRASRALYARIGYRSAVLDAYESTEPEGPREWDRFADAAWGAGRYRLALHAWRRAYPTTEPEDRARLHEREGAVLWITGRLRRAERHLWNGITQFGTDDAVTERTKTVLLETYGRTVIHMRRLPDTRLLVRRSRADKVQQLLDDLSTDTGKSDRNLGVLTTNVRSALARRPDDQISAHIERFDQSESLHAWLNYTHAHLRQVAEIEPSDSRLTAADYTRQLRRESALGASADAARVLLLPNAHRHFTVRDFTRAFHNVEMSTWHRARLILAFTIRRLLARKASTITVG